MGRPRMKPKTQLKNVIVVSQDLRAALLIAMMPVMTQCQIQSCKHILTVLNAVEDELAPMFVLCHFFVLRLSKPLI
jgi:hypothetical protein